MTQEPSQLFGEIRSLMQAPPSSGAWLAMTSLIDACERLDPRFLEDVVTPYVMAHILSWPVELRVAPQHWVEALFSSDPPAHGRIVTALKLMQRGLSDKDILHMSQHPTLSQMHWLDLSHNWLMESGAEHLCRSPHAHNLGTLDLSYNQLKDSGAARFAGTNALNRLHTLSLARNDLTLKGFLAMQQARFVPRMRSLDLSSNWLRVSHADDAFFTHDFQHLRRLDLSNNQLGDRGITLMLRQDAEHLPALEELTLHHTGLTAHAMEDVAQSMITSQLRVLDLSDNHIQSQGLHTLMESSHLRQLEHLSLKNTGNANDAILALCDTPHLTSLRHLNLAKTSLGVLGAELLANSTNLQALVSLELQGNELGREAMNHLVRWAGLGRLVELDLAHNELDTWALMTLLEGLDTSARLETLTLDHNQLLPRTGTEHHTTELERLDLSKLSPGLRNLSMINCQLNDRALDKLLSSGRINDLSLLDLRYNAISDGFVYALLQHLSPEAELTLDLRYTSLTMQGILALQEELPQCHLIR